MSAKSLLLGLVLVACLAITVDALCCPWVLNSSMKCQCADGGLVHPWDCCATGGCNVFCCNCAGECRKNETTSTREKRENPLQASIEFFESLDKDGDSMLSYDESFAYLMDSSKLLDNPDWFADMDIDGDGFIRVEEFDDDIADALEK